MIDPRQDVFRPPHYLYLFLAVAILLLVACGGAEPGFELSTSRPTEVDNSLLAASATSPPSATNQPVATPAPVSTDTLQPPTATAEPTLQPTLPSLPADPAALPECINWPHPGLLFQDPLESPPLSTSFLVVDPYGGQACRLVVNPYPRGRIESVIGAIFYSVYDSERGDLTVWRRFQGEMAEPLLFTSTSYDGFTPIGLAVSAGAGFLAWSRVTPAADGSTARLEMWSAAIGGDQLTTLVEQQLDLAQDGMRFLEPIRFSSDNQYLYYSLTPVGLGGAWSSFSAWYDNLYQVAVDGGEPELIFDCRAKDLFLCLGDFFEETGRLAYVNDAAHQVVVAGWSGETVAVIEPPGRDYTGYPVFGPAGELAFTSADLDDDLAPRPGIISLLLPPYTGPAQELLRSDDVGILWQWLDQAHLLYEVRPDQNPGTGLINTGGQVIASWPYPNYLQAVLR